MKVAIIYFGLARGLAVTMPSIREHLLSRLAAEGHLITSVAALSNIDTLTNPRTGEIGAPVTPSDIFNLSADTYIFARNNNEEIASDLAAAQFQPDYYSNNWISVRNSLFQLLNLQRAYDHLASRNLLNQDLYVFARPDLQYIDPFNLVEIYETFQHRENNVAVPKWHSFGGLNDRIAVTDLRGAIAYANRRAHITEYCHDRPYHPESLLAFTMSKHGCNVHELPVRAHRVGANNQIQKENFAISVAPQRLEDLRYSDRTERITAKATHNSENQTAEPIAESSVLFESSTMRVEHFYDPSRANKALAFVFTPSYNRSLEGNKYGGDALFRNGYDIIAMKINNDDWFQQTPEQFFDIVNTLTIDWNYTKKIGCGSSMGAYASLAFSRRLGLDAVIAFSPQYCINEKFDTRWASFGKNITFKYLISKDSIAPQCDYFIFYDNKDTDNLHVLKLIECLPQNKTTLIELPYTGHPCTHFLNDVGLLKELVLRISAGKSTHAIDLMCDRRKSKSYLQNFVERLLLKNHYKWALAGIDAAAALGPLTGIGHRQKSIALEKLNRIEEAITSIKNAIQIEPTNPHSLYQLSSLMNKLGDTSAAIDAAKKAVSHSPDNPHLLGFLARLLLKAGELNQALAEINRAINIDRTLPGLYMYKNEIYRKMGDADSAKDCVQTAVRLSTLL